MKIKKILLILTLLSTNLYLIKAQEDKPREVKPDISTINNDMKMLISNLLLTDGGSLKDLFSYLSTNKEIVENFAKYDYLYDYLKDFIIKYINSLNSDQQKKVFKDIIEALKSKEPVYVQVALYITKKLCEKSIIKKLVNNIVTSETATADILNYFPIDKKVNKLIKNNGLYDCLQKDIEEYINKNNDNQKKQLFKMAAKAGHLYIIELLLEGKSITPMDKVVALAYAAQNGHINIVKLLLKEESIPYPDKGFALKYAAKNGHKDIVELLLKEEGINPIDKGLALRNAAEGDYKDIEKLIEENIISKNKNFALVWSAKGGRKEIVELLLKEKDISVAAKRNALVHAAGGGHKDIVELLLKEEGVTSKSKGKALKEAACNGYKDLVKLLLQEDVSSSDKSVALRCVNAHKNMIFSNTSVYKDIAELLENSMNFKDQLLHFCQSNVKSSGFWQSKKFLI